MRSHSRYVDEKEGVVAEKAKGGADWTPLQGAVAQGHAEIVEVLLAYRGEPDFAGLKDATVPQTATSQGRLDIIGLLLGQGADLNLADTDGQTALHKASAEGRSDILQVLLASKFLNKRVVSLLLSPMLKSRRFIGSTLIWKAPYSRSDF
ncbi:ankyrin repeat-containing domain protein [Mycena rebaudengoi]|nr:ankyrin repeat-containing domain protein [Mycena rebaudengoi]